MSKQAELTLWIEKAGKLTTPLLFQVSKGLYEVYAKELILPVIGDIYGHKERFKYNGVVPVLPTVIPTWDWLDATLIDKIETGEIFDEVIPEPEPEPEPEPTPPEVLLATASELPDFGPMTKKEIDDWAQANGIEVDGRKSKKDMIEAIEATIK